MRKNEKNSFLSESARKAVKKLTKKYSYSVRPCEIEDLEQTIWFLFLVARTLYDPTKGFFEGFAFYFADRKLKDHFSRRVKLPKSEGKFTLLHIKASSLKEDPALETPERSKDFPRILKMKAEGYSFKEISEKLGVSYATVRRRWKKAASKIKDRL